MSLGGDFQKRRYTTTRSPERLPPRPKYSSLSGHHPAPEKAQTLGVKILDKEGPSVGCSPAAKANERLPPPRRQVVARSVYPP